MNYHLRQPILSDEEFNELLSMIDNYKGKSTQPKETVDQWFEFSVFDSEYVEQAGGTAPTYSQALSEGQHYLAMYSQDGRHYLELRRVETLSCHAAP